MSVATFPRPDRRTEPRPRPARRMDHPRITLIVDHPLRDLGGMVLTAIDLCRRGATCYLTPLNLCDLDVPRQAPDLVLTNYYRKNFAFFFQQLVDLGIGIVVLDTEGGVLERVDTLTGDLVPDAALRAAVRRYCCWGPKVAQQLIDDCWFTADQVRVTGCPRTDFYAPAFRKAVLAGGDFVAPYAQNLILVNANFSIGNPGFLSVEDQFRLLVERLGHPPERVRDWQQKEVEGMRQLAALANTLARRFPQATVVYRPHPFERLETYDDLLAPRPNLHCLRTGSVDAWILHAAVVIQRSCSTSIEAGMAGTAALMPQWIATPFERPAANRTSTPCANQGELVATVARILAGHFETPAAVAANYRQVVRDWFFRVDGQAHRRVADAILESVDTNAAARARRRRTLHRTLYGQNRSLFSRRRWRGTVRSALGLPPTWSLLHGRDRPTQPERLDRWHRSAKYFDAGDVRRIVSAVLACQDASSAAWTIERAGRETDYQCGYNQGRAVKIECDQAGCRAGRRG